jgi:hypothetical protein
MQTIEHNIEQRISGVRVNGYKPKNLTKLKAIFVLTKSGLLIFRKKKKTYINMIIQFAHQLNTEYTVSLIHR